jgi:hypothetical protein
VFLRRFLVDAKNNEKITTKIFRGYPLIKELPKIKISLLKQNLRDRIYGFLDWENGQGDFYFSTIETLCLFIFGAATLVHVILYGLSFLKFKIADSCAARRKTDATFSTNL